MGGVDGTQSRASTEQLLVSLPKDFPPELKIQAAREGRSMLELLDEIVRPAIEAREREPTRLRSQEEPPARTKPLGR